MITHTPDNAWESDGHGKIVKAKCRSGARGGEQREGVDVF